MRGRQRGAASPLTHPKATLNTPNSLSAVATDNSPAGSARLARAPRHGRRMSTCLWKSGASGRTEAESDRLNEGDQLLECRAWQSELFLVIARAKLIH